MLFRQLFDRSSCTYTYLLADETTRAAVIIDPVRELVERDLSLIDELSLALRVVLETHVHADHVTASGLLRARTGAEIGVAAAGEVKGACRPLRHGDVVEFGRHRIEVRATPGHTNSCLTYVLIEQGMAFTGDTLMIRGCGRTDFQQGSSPMLYASVHEQIFSLPSSTRLYPGHDYKGRTVTTVAEETAHNPRLGGGRTVDQFTEIMAGLGLAYPAKIDLAVPANQRCGWLAGDPPEIVGEGAGGSL